MTAPPVAIADLPSRAADDGQVLPQRAELESLLAGNPLFNNFSEQQLATFASLIREVRSVERGAYLVREGDEAGELFVVTSGLFEVLKNEPGADKAHQLAVLGPGKSVGEVALLDPGPRSASVRALEDSSVLVVPIRDFQALSRVDDPVDVRMRTNLAHEMGRRLRTTNEMTVRSLQEKLAEAEKRAEMGKFLTRVLVGLALYMFALGFTTALARVVPDTSVISLPILAAFAFGVWRTVKTSPYPAAQYGFTLRDWRRHAAEAILLSLPVAGLIVLAKALAVSVVPSMMGQPVFDLARSTGLSLPMVLAFSLAYAAFTPVQEMIARSGIQCSCQMFLTGRYRVLTAIFLSNLLFSATHLHVSLTLAAMVFPFGMFWGWLFWRQGSLVGSSVSHALLGLFGIFVVGFDVF